jgi:hypothetical protein
MRQDPEMLLIAQEGGVPEERVGQNCGLVVTVRAALKRRLVLTNHVAAIETLLRARP